MTDLRSAFDELAGPAAPPTASEIDADLARGRQALRRRRTTRTMGITAAAAAVVAAFSFAVTTDGPHGPPAAVGERPATVTGARLVAYEGKQPKGFTIDKVPAGWFIQSDNSGSLLLAPEAAKKPGPDVNPSTNPLYDDQSFVGKIGIFLQSKDQHGVPDGRKVKVGDRDGVLVQQEGESSWTLWIEQPNGVYVLIQFWEDFGLSPAQMAELGAGVHVHPGAVQGVG